MDTGQDPSVPPLEPRGAAGSRRRLLVGGLVLGIVVVAVVVVALRPGTTGPRQEGAAGVSTSLSAGMFGACAIGGSGDATCWGWDEFGQTATPAEESFDSVSSGIYHNCGVLRSGEVRCWGDDAFGKHELPGGPFSTIAVGAEHTCGLLEDGSVVCAGRDNVGQATPPDGVRLVSLSTMVDHTCGLTEDGRAVCWGSDTRGETQVPQDLTFSAVEVTHRGTCGLTESGDVRCWGRPDLERAADGRPLVTFTLGMDHACGLTEDGEAICWGSSRDGESDPPTDVVFDALSAGDGFTCGTTIGEPEGAIRCWGYGDGARLPTDGAAPEPAG